MPYGLYYPRSSTQAIYRFDNNLNDSSGNSKTLTCSGTAHYGQDHSRFGTHGIQTSGEYCYINENFGWDMHKGLMIIFWMKCTAAGTAPAGSGYDFISVDDATYKGGFGLQITDDGVGNLSAYTFLRQYNSGPTVITYASASILTIGSYGYWALYVLHYTYSFRYYCYLYQFDPTGQTNSYSDRKTNLLGSVNQAAYTGTGSTSDKFSIGDIGAAGNLTIEIDEVIVDTTDWTLLAAGDDLQEYYTKVSSGLWCPKSMF